MQKRCSRNGRRLEAKPPKYEVISQSGPDHAPDFLVQVMLDSGETADALAGSKRQAEQMAAKSLLQTMRELI